MIKPPFKIFYNKRPLRIAYFIDENKATENDIIEIIKYSSKLWGGRYNPILLVGEQLNEVQWDFLKSYDPDIIKSSFLLKDDLLNEIERKLCPYLIINPNTDAQESGPYIYETPAYAKLNPFNYKLINKSYFDRDISLFHLDYVNSKNLEKCLIQFLTVNFGIYEPTVVNTLKIEDCQQQIFEISNEDSFLNSLEEITKSHRKIFQNQISALPNYLGEPIDRKTIQFDFNIIVGDSIKDLILYWNNIFSQPDYNKTDLRQIWLPKEIVNNQKYLEPVKELIKFYYSESWQNNPAVKFISTSLDDDEIVEISNNLTKNNFIIKRSNIFKDKEIIPPRLSTANYLSSIKTFDYVKLTEIKDTYEIEAPNELMKIDVSESWAIDLFIEYKSKRFENIHGPNYWLQLPKRNWLSQIITNYDSRVNENHFITLFAKGANPRIKIDLYDDFYMFRSLLTNWAKGRFYPPNDPRSKLTKNLFEDVNFSDKGKYLSGTLELFGGIFNANTYLTERYWRKIFDYMSNRKKISLEYKKENFDKLIKEKFNDTKSISDFTNNKIEFITNLILKTLGEAVQKSKEIPLEFFESLAKEEIDEYNRIHNEEFIYDRRDLLQLLNHLLYLNILMIGIRPTCPNCGFKNWTQVGEIDHKITCNGCKYEFIIDSEPKWFYKLNTLFELGYAQQGLSPIIIVLGDLLSQARSSFLFTPSLEVYDEYDNTLYYDKNIKPSHEIDILCIVDGKFIIGEVKEKNKNFSKKDFDSMLEVAKRIKPDKVIFSSLEPIPTKNIIENIEKLQDNVKDLGINVEWFKISEFHLEPSIVR